jgi:hypothetical protein
MLHKPFKQLVISGMLLGSCAAQAELFVDSSDLYLRTDMQLLAEYGLIASPLNTYPLRWQAIGQELKQVDANRLSGKVAEVYQRVYQRYLTEQQASIQGKLSASIATDAAQFRHFGADYREKQQATASVSFQSDYLAGKGSVTLAKDATDGKNTRPDDSYLALVVDRWTLSAGYIDQWWGPGVDSSLHKSTNARPMPGVMLTGYHPADYDYQWLNWLGPWSLQSSVSRMEHERVVANPLLWSNRLNLRPIAKLEIGLSLTAQICGEGINCGVDAFKDVLFGDTNCSNNSLQCSGQELSNAGNQIAGFDIQYRDLWFGRPISIYIERTCEDKSGSSPFDIADCATMAGGHSWLQLAQQQVKVFIEYSDTMVACGDDAKQYNCFYEHSTYGSGSRYYQRSLGSTYDSDARSWVLGAVTRFPDQSGLYATIRNIKLNYDGAKLSANYRPVNDKQQIVRLDLNYQRPFWHGTLKLGASTANIQYPDAADKRENTLYSGYVYQF